MGSNTGAGWKEEALGDKIEVMLLDALLLV
jgi:hypothetical protein